VCTSRFCVCKEYEIQLGQGKANECNDGMLCVCVFVCVCVCENYYNRRLDGVYLFITCIINDHIQQLLVYKAPFSQKRLSTDDRGCTPYLLSSNHTG
jgi:hypothetical protein